MADLSFHLPSRIIFGADSLSRLGTLAAGIGERALLITEFVLHDAKIIERASEILRKRSIDVIVLDNMSPGKIFGSTQEIVDLARAGRIHVIIGMGGMRVLSLARKIACLVTAGDPSPGGLPRALPYIEIPTIPRDTLLLTDKYIDFDIVNRMPKLEPAPHGLVHTAVVDPGLSAGLPPKTVGTLVMDIALSAVEGILSNRSNFVSEALLLEALKVVGDCVLEGVRGPMDIAYRNAACQAGLLAAMGHAFSSGGAGTAIAFAINTLYRVPKSFLGTVLLPHLLDHAASIRPEKAAKIAAALGEDIFSMAATEAARLAAVSARRMIAQLGLPARLRDFNLRLEDLVVAAEAALTMDDMRHLPLPMTADQLYELIKRSY